MRLRIHNASVNGIMQTIIESEQLDGSFEFVRSVDPTDPIHHASVLAAWAKRYDEIDDERSAAYKKRLQADYKDADIKARKVASQIRSKMTERDIHGRSRSAFRDALGDCVMSDVLVEKACTLHSHGYL